MFLFLPNAMKIKYFNPLGRLIQVPGKAQEVVSTRSCRPHCSEIETAGVTSQKIVALCAKKHGFEYSVSETSRRPSKLFVRAEASTYRRFQTASRNAGLWTQTSLLLSVYIKKPENNKHRKDKELVLLRPPVRSFGSRGIYLSLS